MTMSGSLPSFPVATTSVDPADYEHFRHWASYAAELTGLVIRSDELNPDQVVLVSFELAPLEEPVGNNRAVSGPMQIVLDTRKTGFNGLDSGAVAAGETYYIWLVGHDNNDDKLLEQCGAILSLSNTAPAMPTVDGVTLDFKWLIGCCFTNTYKNIIPFSQEDDLFSFDEAQLLTTLNTTGTHAIDCNPLTPAGCHELEGHLKTDTTSGTTECEIFTFHGLTTEQWNCHGTAGNDTNLTFSIPELLEGSDRTFDLVIAGTSFIVSVLVDGFYWPEVSP